MYWTALVAENTARLTKMLKINVGQHGQGDVQWHNKHTGHSVNVSF